VAATFTITSLYKLPAAYRLHSPGGATDARHAPITTCSTGVDPSIYRSFHIIIFLSWSKPSGKLQHDILLRLSQLLCYYDVTTHRQASAP